MAQSTLDDDELFTEASDEMKTDVTEAIENARESLPDSDSLMDVEAGNIIGVLNSLKSSLDAGDAVEDLREAKKWFEIGKRADAFDEEFIDETESELEDIEEVIDAIETAGDAATELTDSIATLKSKL